MRVLGKVGARGREPAVSRHVPGMNSLPAGAAGSKRNGVLEHEVVRLHILGGASGSLAAGRLFSGQRPAGARG